MNFTYFKITIIVVFSLFVYSSCETNKGLVSEAENTSQTSNHSQIHKIKTDSVKIKSQSLSKPITPINTNTATAARSH